MSKPRFFITDVFTSKKYGGNPLATFVDCESLTEDEMQKIAKEINFSETTFITSTSPSAGGYNVRIFTPNAEVEFAGHPTLGTAYIIREKLKLETSDKIVLNLPVGKVTVAFNSTGEIPEIWMKQPTPEFRGVVEANEMAKVLSISASDISHETPIEEVSTGFPTLIVPLNSLEALKRVNINKEAYFCLANDAWAKVILVFSQESYEEAQDLSVRVFGDYYGIPEDAATGSSNGSLAAYLSHHELLGTSRIDVKVGQGYEMGRPSTLELRTSPNEGEVEVFVGGSVIAVAEGVWG